MLRWGEGGRGGFRPRLPNSESVLESQSRLEIGFLEYRSVNIRFEDEKVHKKGYVSADKLRIPTKGS